MFKKIWIALTGITFLTLLIFTPLAFCADSKTQSPGAVTPAMPSGTVTQASPIFKWEADELATWYRLFIWDNNQTKIFAKWYESDDICEEDNCTVAYESQFSDGSYEWFIRSWNDSGSTWGSGLSFSVQGVGSSSNDPPSKITLISPSGTIETSTVTFTWDEDDVATWYKLYVKNTSTNEKFVQWYEIENNYSGYPDVTCSGGKCSVTISSQLEDGPHEWYVLGWNQNGNGTWSNGINCTVDSDDSPGECFTSGTDTFEATSSADIFYFCDATPSLNSTDTIYYFTAGSDIIDLSYTKTGTIIDWNSSSDGGAFTDSSQFKGNVTTFEDAEATLNGKQVLAVYQQDEEYLWVDADMDGTLDSNDYKIYLPGVISISTTDLGFIEK